MKPPAEYKDFQLAIGASAFIGGGAFILWGGSAAGQTAAVVTAFKVFDGKDTNGQIVYEAIINAQQTVPILLPECGVLCQAGIVVLAATQAVNGAVYFTPVTRHGDGWIDRYANRYDFFDSP